MGLKGVKKVEKGLDNSKEINTVHYDLSVIMIKEMEEALSPDYAVGIVTRIEKSQRNAKMER